jgi:hypothetical protein
MARPGPCAGDVSPRPHLSTRSVRVHQVSRSASRQLQHDKARHVPRVAGPIGPLGPERGAGPGHSTYTGKDKFPSQHPWFGYK